MPGTAQAYEESSATKARPSSPTRAIARSTSDADLASGCLYPPLADIRHVSFEIAVAVAGYAWENGLCDAARPDDVAAHVRGFVYEPDYVSSA